jgi:hypothetical protein
MRANGASEANRWPGGAKALFVRLLRNYVAEEHCCTPPDGASGWQPAPRQTAGPDLRMTYPCAECGQLWHKRFD